MQIECSENLEETAKFSFSNSKLEEQPVKQILIELSRLEKLNTDKIGEKNCKSRNKNAKS